MSKMKIVRIALILLIVMITIRILSVLVLFYPDLYWISPYSLILDRLQNSDSFYLIHILDYLYYPNSFLLPWFIIYYCLNRGNESRIYQIDRLGILAKTGMISLGWTFIYSNFILYFKLSGTDSKFITDIFTSISFIISLILLATIVVLPNLRYLKLFKILLISKYILNYTWILIISQWLVHIISSSTIITLIGIVLTNLIGVISYYFLMKFIEYELIKPDINQ